MHIDEYERKQALYESFAQTVAAVLSAAIQHEGGYRLQVVRARAKDATSLRKKLSDKGWAASEQIDQQIKDLAGCRAIFYTNGDVEKLIGSGLVEANFEVLDRKVHNPDIDPKTSTRMYTANHYVVSLRPDRLALPEYARFANMRCEIQLQTILNHAWAELEHDIIYKAPELSPSFGAEALESIKQRLQNIAAKYLLPAGYEFHKATVDFDRLVQGKALLDRNSLAAISQAQDNNARFDAIQTFAEHVLPLYDDPQSVMAEVTQVLLDAADQASKTDTVPIDTPFGVIAGKTFEDLVELLRRVFRPYLYLDVARTLDVVRHLHRLARTPAEREHVRELAHSVAKHDLDIWRAHGPAVQRLVVDYVANLHPDDLRLDLSLLGAMLEDVLDPEATGSKFSSTAVSIGRGAVVASPELKEIRDDALTQLKRLFESAESESEQNRVVSAMFHAAQPPYGAATTRELSKVLIGNAVTLLEFASEIVGGAGLEAARKLEMRVHRTFKLYQAVRPELADDPELQQLTTQISDATSRFRSKLQSVADLESYKVLVGFDSVFPGGWGNRDLDYAEAEQYRSEQAELLLAKIDADNFVDWLDTLERFAQTESDDAATFPQFAKFLEQLAKREPELTLAHLDRINGKLARFLFKFLAGLLLSTKAPETHALIAQWLSQGEKLSQVSWLLVAAKALPPDLIRLVLNSAIAHGDREAAKDVVRACASHFSSTHPEASTYHIVLLEAIQYLVQLGDYSWIRMGTWFSWYHSEILHALDDATARQFLSWLVRIPDLTTEADHIIASIVKGRPTLALDFLDQRMTLGRADEIPGLVPIPYELHETREALQQVPQELLALAKRWFDADDQSLDYSVEQVIETVFGDFPPLLRTTLDTLLKSGQRSDALFALEILGAFKSQQPVFELAREAAACWGRDEELASRIHLAIAHEGSTEGFFGRVKALQAKKAQLKEWRADPREGVKSFADEAILSFDQRIAAETRRTQALLASRRLDYGEDPLGDASADESADPDTA